MNFFKNSFFYIAATLIAGAANYVFQLVVSRNLSVADFGELQALFSLVAIVGIISGSIGNFVIRQTSAFFTNQDYQSNNDFLHWLMPIIFKIIVIFLAVIFAISPLIIKFLHLTNPWALYLLMFVSMIGIVSAVYNGILSGWQKFNQVNINAVISASAKVLLGFLAVVIIPTLTSVSASFLSATIISAIILWFFAHRQFHSKSIEKGDGRWREKYFANGSLLRIFLATAIFSSLISILSNLDVLIIKNITSAEFTGYYGVLGLLGKIVLWINSAIIAVVLPMACAKGHQGNGLDRKIYFSAYAFILLVSGVAILAYAFFPDFIITLMFGARYIIFAGDLWLFGLVSLGWSILFLESNLAYARHNHKISLVLVFTIILMIAGIYNYHETMRQTAMALAVPLFLGYAGALLINLFKKDKEMAVDSLPLPISRG